jgi:hypothetical protein
VALDGEPQPVQRRQDPAPRMDGGVGDEAQREPARPKLGDRLAGARDGLVADIAHAETLVRGDVLLLAAGDRLSAEARLPASVELHVDMSTLTGESRPVVRYVADPGAAPGPLRAGARARASRSADDGGAGAPRPR